MENVVAGVFFLLAAVVGASTFMLLPQYETAASQNDNSDGDGVAPAKKKATAATISNEIKSLGWKQWLLICAIAMLTGVAAFRLLSMNMQLPTLARLLATAILLIPVMIIDWKTRRIPNLLVLAVLLLGALFLAVEYFWYPQTFSVQLLTSGIGLLVCLVLFYVLARLTKNGIGMGDVKILAAQGWMVGLSVTLMVTIFSLLACSFVAVGLLLFGKKKASDHIPFGPFLFLGYILALLFYSF